MTRLVSLDKNAHRHTRIDTKKIEAQGAELNMVPVTLSEFLKLAVQYPIAFTKNKETGRFVCVALFGFNPGENFFWKNNVWDAVYIPLNITRQPFFVGTNNSSNENEHFVICIDQENAGVQTGSGEALFDSQGNDTPYLEKTKSALAQLLNGEEHTQKFINKMIEFKLLQPMRLEITFANSESTRVEGMYTINEDRLGELAKDDIFELQSSGYLKYIYIIITSLGHIYSLINKKNSLLTQEHTHA